MISILSSSYKNIFLIGLLVLLITAFFSLGYFHPDEHFQILEFCSYKLGNSPALDLPWEFQERIRSALQPALGIALIKTMNVLGINNPFTITLVFRILTALLSWLVLSNISLLLIKDFSSDYTKRIFLYFAFLLWFVPLISVRFSSENYSALTFLAAVYFISSMNTTGKEKKGTKLLIAGLLLGFSFFFRFQIGFAILGLALWLLFINKMHLQNILILVCGGLAALSISVYIDYWFYGEFELTPLNYFIANITENKAANWGTSPWWFYFSSFILSGVPPISIVLLILFFMGIYFKPKSLFVWSIIPFLIGHFIVGHKELRFLFPMQFAFIYIAALGIDIYIDKLRFNRLSKIIWVFSIAINSVFLIYIMFSPAQEAFKYQKFLYNQSKKKEVIVLCKQNNVYELVGMKVNFYKPKNIKCIVVGDDTGVRNYLEKFKPSRVCLLEENFLSEEKYSGYTNQTIYSFFPKWIAHLNFNNWISRARIWKIQEIKKSKTE